MPPPLNEQPSETAPKQKAFQKQITEQQDQHGFHGSYRMVKSVLSVRSDRRIADSDDKETTFRRIWYTTAEAGRLWPELINRTIETIYLKFLLLENNQDLVPKF